MYSWSHCSRASWIGVTGLMGVLLRAKRDGQIRSVKPELELFGPGLGSLLRHTWSACLSTTRESSPFLNT